MGNRHYPGRPRAAPAKAARVFAALLLASLLSACGGAADVTRPARPSARMPLPASWPLVMPADPASANSVLMRALSLVGTPYRYGGDSPEGGFDCSGLVVYVYRDVVPRPLPRTSVDLWWSSHPTGGSTT
jgi:cell wall-associated NlpC family hydrolase